MSKTHEFVQGQQKGYLFHLLSSFSSVGNETFQAQINDGQIYRNPTHLKNKENAYGYFFDVTLPKRPELHDTLSRDAYWNMLRKIRRGRQFNIRTVSFKGA